jgi:hypothetical protein
MHGETHDKSKYVLIYDGHTVYIFPRARVQDWLKQQNMQTEHDRARQEEDMVVMDIRAPTSPKLHRSLASTTSTMSTVSRDAAVSAAPDIDGAPDFTDARDRDRFLKRRAVAAFEENREELRAILEANSVAPTTMLMQDLLAWRIQL